MTPRIFPAGEPPPLPRRPWHDRYFAMYSSEWEGITTDPARMAVPIDDHLVHRGDGVFETIKCVRGALYALDGHLDRLARSAAAIGLRAPPRGDLRDIAVATIRAGGHADCLLRLILSRGPGGMSVDPAECPRPGLYALVYRLPPSYMELHPEGARAVIVEVPLKPAFFATIKTCNYLPNALMKAAATRAGADFPLAMDERGFLAEGATENAAVVTAEGVLRFPRPGRILPGITAGRVAQLAKGAVATGVLRAVEEADVDRAELARAAEVLILGTTPDVTSVVAIDGQRIGDGRPGPVRHDLQRRLAEDQILNPEMRTPVFEETAG